MVWWAKIINLEELGFKVGPSIFGGILLFSTPIVYEGFKPYKTHVLNRS